MKFVYLSSYRIKSFKFNLSLWNKERIVSIYQILKNTSTYNVLFNYYDFKDITENYYLYNLDNHKDKNCIFCLKSSGEVSFNKFPHIIPYLLGNNFLLHHEECDECNHFFGQTLECELDKYLTPYRTLNKLKNRAGNLIKTEMGKNRSFRFDQSRNIFIGELHEDEISFDDASNIVTFNLNQNKYSPMLVYKALMKIFYGLLPREYLPKFEILRKWIISKDNSFIPFSPLMAMKTRLDGFSTSVLDVIILNKETTDFEEFKKELPPNEDFDFIAYLRFGHIVFEFPIFTDLSISKLRYMIDTNSSSKLNLPYIYKIGFPTNGEWIDFSETEKVSTKEPMYFSFDKKIKEKID